MSGVLAAGEQQPYACDPQRSAGRRLHEPPAPTRSEYQRDRDRIVHSTAFRRLVYKTQVFLNHEGDLFRTRLTHSLEVAQLGRSIARSLGLNEDLVEAVALAHDLGHTPFGHAGQDALNDCLTGADPRSGGFEHNLQSLRVVDSLEERYPQFDGLNLTLETREGILKHCSGAAAARLEAKEPGGVARRFVERLRPSLEAQLCNLADEIAYNAHDVDDGVRSGLLKLEQLDEVPLFARHKAESLAAHPGLHGKRLLFESIRRMLSAQVYDVLAASAAAIALHGPRTVEDVRQAPAMICFSAQMAADSIELKRFLRHNLYRHPQVVATTDRAKQVVRELFAIYREAPAEWIPAGEARPAGLRQLADYVAGMTDRYALREHERLTGRRLFD
jgi:dGTPase